MVERRENPLPWQAMIFSALLVTLPLILGWMRDAWMVGVFTSLVAYFSFLVDPRGALFYRSTLVILAAVLLVLGFWLGQSLAAHSGIYSLALALFVLLFGVWTGKGDALERFLLFFLVEFLVGFYSPHPKFLIDGVFLFVFGFVAFGLLCAAAVLGRENKLAQKISWRQSVKLSQDQVLYSLSLLAAVLLATYFVDYFSLARGYWTVITVLVVMRAERKDSIHRSLHRIGGTFVGALVADGILSVVTSPLLLIGCIALCGLLVPLVLTRSYWILSCVVCCLVIFLLGLFSVGNPDHTIALLRVLETIYGCGFSILGSLLYFGLKRWEILGKPWAKSV